MTQKTNARHDGGRAKPKKRIIISAVIITVMVVLIGFSALKISEWAVDNQYSNNMKDIAQSFVETLTTDLGNGYESVAYDVDFESLRLINPDTVAWLKVENTNIEYPVVQSDDNEFYLSHSFDQSENGAGWIFADWSNTLDGEDKNLVIYGHNRKDNSLFGSLSAVLSKEWCEDENNRYITLITDSEYAFYEVFSVYSVPVEDYYITTSFSDDAAFRDFLATILNRSEYDFGLNLSTDDKILTLSTCSNISSYRVVLHARKVKG